MYNTHLKIIAGAGAIVALAFLALFAIYEPIAFLITLGIVLIVAGAGCAGELYDRHKSKAPSLPHTDYYAEYDDDDDFWGDPEESRI